MSEAGDTVKTGNVRPLDEDVGDEEKDAKCDVVQDESETRSKTCKFTSFNKCSS